MGFSKTEREMRQREYAVTIKEYEHSNRRADIKAIFDRMPYGMPDLRNYECEGQMSIGDLEGMSNGEE